MKRFKAMGLCLVAALAISLVGIASASAAEPEYGVCKKEAGAATHQYTDAACQVESAGGNTGKYTWIPGPNGALANATGKTGQANLETPGLGKVECASSSFKAKILNTKEAEITGNEYTGCKSNGEVCTGAAKGVEAPGDIETFALKATIGYIKDAGDADEVGNDVVGTGPGGQLAEFKCGAVGIKSFGSVIDKINGVTDVKPPASHTEVFVNLAGKQEPENFEGEPKDTLLSEFSVAPGMKFNSVQEETVTTKSKLEIKA